MKIKLCFCLTAAAVILICKNVYAGDINPSEASVIAAAGGEFEYGGKMYTAKAEYISQLENKLSADGIDLTAQQAGTAIAAIKGNIPQGIAQGYLEEVTKVNNTEEDTQSESIQTETQSGSTRTETQSESVRTETFMPDSDDILKEPARENGDAAVMESLLSTETETMGQKEITKGTEDLSGIPKIRKTPNVIVVMAAIIIIAALLSVTVFGKRK